MLKYRTTNTTGHLVTLDYLETWEPFDTSHSACQFVPGKGVGDEDVLLAGDFLGIEDQCALAVRRDHPAANGVRLHGNLREEFDGQTRFLYMCSAVYNMRHIELYGYYPEPDPKDEQRSCYLFPSSSVKNICAAEPKACSSTYVDETLSLADSAIVGSLPTELGNLHATLLHLDLSRNSGLSGTLPTELGRLTNLRTLAVDECQISGTIPSEIGRLHHLQFYGIHGNRLSGSVPSELGVINPPFCYLTAQQRRRGERDEQRISGSFPITRDNRFECPLPPLSAGCGMHTVSFAQRDGHHKGSACPNMHVEGKVSHQRLVDGEGRGGDEYMEDGAHPPPSPPPPPEIPPLPPMPPPPPFPPGEEAGSGSGETGTSEGSGSGG